MRNIFLIIIFFSSLSAYSQKTNNSIVAAKPKPVISVTAAKSQRWSGGVVGHMGNRYYIDFTTLPGKAITPDTILIGNKCFPLHIYEGEFPTGQDVNCKLTKGKSRWVYNFYVNQAETTDTPNSPDVDSNKKVEVQPEVPAYKGDAAIIYTYNHKKKLKVIQSFTRLQPVNYP